MGRVEEKENIYSTVHDPCLYQNFMYNIWNNREHLNNKFQQMSAGAAKNHQMMLYYLFFYFCVNACKHKDACMESRRRTRAEG